MNLKSTSKDFFNVDQLGQVFTPSFLAEFMAGLLKNNGKVLEPSCGDGVFLKYLKNFLAIEIDNVHAPKEAEIMDFFALPITEKFDSIIGNPPYVRFQDIQESTKLLLDLESFDKRTNLYIFFIDKSIDHLNENGEIVFIVPRDFIKSTACKNLNQKLSDLGTITHLLDLGDSKIFKNAAPNCVIFRFEKNNFLKKSNVGNIYIDRSKTSKDLSEVEWETHNFSCNSGQLLFTSKAYPNSLNKIADVKVGAVSGADEIFGQKVVGNLEFVYSGTAKYGNLKSMYYPTQMEDAIEHLAKFKSVLKARRIKNFTEDDWWQWGRGYPVNNMKRVYVNCKTRNSDPFFTNSCINFDGSVMAIFPKNQHINIDEFCAELNKVDWQELGFLCDGRYLFTQRSLVNCPLPEVFSKFSI